MKRIAFIPLLAALALAGCAQHLSDKDRALLMEAHDLAQQAQISSAQAVTTAQAAKAEADKAEADAAAANEKAHRMFRASQNK